MKTKKKTVNRQVRVLEARDLFSVTGGACGCGATPRVVFGMPSHPPKRPGMPPGAVGLPSHPPTTEPRRPGMPPGALGMPSFPPKR